MIEIRLPLEQVKDDFCEKRSPFQEAAFDLLNIFHSGFQA